MNSRRRSTKGMGLYSNLSSRRKANKDLKARRKAEYLASLPKHPVKRFAYRLHPKRFFSYWFSREGALMMLKIAGIGTLLLFLMLGALFAYYRQELDGYNPGEIDKRVQTTVTRYLDRNGVLLWEDKGTGNYKLVVDSKDISQYMKDATVALEDRDFYQHSGFSISGIARAAINNFSGDSTQGGSTLTQQLVKQVFLADEAQDRGLSGIPRKIKELMLAVEVERRFSKEQILELYLNESPYGGRRNGVESAAQTYFGKKAKDLTLAEAALLASIPQQPGRYDPYTAMQDPEAKKDLLARQHTALDYMVEQKMVSSEEAEKAKEIAIFDTIKPESDQYANIKAPHFVQMVKSELERELGQKTVGQGGLTVKTTLDWRVQKIVDREITNLFKSDLPTTAGFDNGAATVIDVPTSQVLALRGSRSYTYPGYGAVNAATSYIQPGSSIKPFVYAALMKQREGVNYGAGSILSDEPLPQSIYTTGDNTSVGNFDNRFRGAIPIRSGLAESRNIPAIKAMYIAGREQTLNTIHDMGDHSYCTQTVDKTVGLAASIGGCGLKQVEHVNAFATMARMGVYKPVSTILEVKNGDGQVIDKWKDEGKRVIDAQIPYIISDILSDDAARAPSFGMGASGLNVPGVKTATKTGTSNLGTKSKDLWMMSYSPRVAMGIWVGNHVPAPMNNALSSIVGPTVGSIMGPIHTEIYAKDGSWKAGDWFNQPAGIQRLTVSGRSDLFPSWYNKNQSTTGTKLTFDKVSKKKATDCTPAAAKIEVSVQKVTDPVTKKTTYLSTEGYDASANDNVHKCENKDYSPNITNATWNGKRIVVSASSKFGLQTVRITADGKSLTAQAIGGGRYAAAFTSDKPQISVTATATDKMYYEGQATFTASQGNSNTPDND